MVNGVEQVRAMFKRKGAAVVAAAKASAQAEGDKVASAMRYLAPREQGELIRSIRSEDASALTSGNGSEVGFIGVKVKAGDATTVVTNSSGGQFQNARIQEFGTKTRAANPYFFPAWRANRSRVRGAITRAVRRAWISG